MEKLMLWRARITIAISPDPAFSLLASVSALHQSVLAKTDFSAVLTYLEHRQRRIGEKRHFSFVQGAVVLFWVVDPFGVFSKCFGSAHNMAARMSIAKNEEHVPQKAKLVRWLFHFFYSCNSLVPNCSPSSPSYLSPFFWSSSSSNWHIYVILEWVNFLKNACMLYVGALFYL